MKKRYVVFAVLGYALGSLIFGGYLLIGLLPHLMMTPTARIMMLGTACLFVYFGSLSLWKGGSNRAVAAMRVAVGFCFGVYLLLLITLVLFDGYFGRGHVTWQAFWNGELRTHYFEHLVNLIPFRTVFEYLQGWMTGTLPAKTVFINLAGNLAAFAPFGLFLPLLRSKTITGWSVLAVTTVCVLLVEGLQMLFLVGSFDIDDLILNVLGACLCYLLFRCAFLKRMIRKLTGICY